jgi:transposase InsO family protein
MRSKHARPAIKIVSSVKLKRKRSSVRRSLRQRRGQTQHQQIVAELTTLPSVLQQTVATSLPPTIPTPTPSTTQLLQNLEEAFKNVYYNVASPGSFGGIESLVRNVHQQMHGAHSLKYIRQRAREWLKSQDTYTLHRPLRLRFQRNRTIVYGIDDQWQADLVDMQEWRRENHGYAHLLTCIDVFSKYAWVRPLLSKSAEAVRAAFEDLFAQADARIPFRLQTDKGKEFLNRSVQNLFKTYGIVHFTTENEMTKASVVERFNRTLKARMWRYFTENGNHQFVDVLQQLVQGYNASYHRTIGLAPDNVTKDKEQSLWVRMFGRGDLTTNRRSSSSSSTPVYTVGTLVRLSKLKWPFEKGYLPNWTDEVFVIMKCIPRLPKPVYKVADTTGEEVSGTFYEEELQTVRKSLNEDEFEVERILEQYVDSEDGSRHALVKWKGWPDKFNSWTRL